MKFNLEIEEKPSEPVQNKLVSRQSEITQKSVLQNSEGFMIQNSGNDAVITSKIRTILEPLEIRWCPKLSEMVGLF